MAHQPRSSTLSRWRLVASPSGGAGRPLPFGCLLLPLLPPLRSSRHPPLLPREPPSPPPLRQLHAPQRASCHFPRVPPLLHLLLLRPRPSLIHFFLLRPPRAPLLRSLAAMRPPRTPLPTSSVLTTALCVPFWCAAPTWPCVPTGWQAPCRRRPGRWEARCLPCGGSWGWVGMVLVSSILASPQRRCRRWPQSCRPSWTRWGG